MGILGPIFKIGEKITEWIPGRIESYKNELDKLKEERAYLLIQKCDDKKANRLIVVDRRIAFLQQRLSNKAQD
jgi:hypothetical protein